MASNQELEQAIKDASAEGNFRDAQVFYEQLVKQQREPRASDQFQYRQTTPVAMGQTAEELNAKFRAEEQERHTNEILFGTGLVVALGLGAIWGWAKRGRLAEMAQGWNLARAIEWAKLAFIIAATVLVLKLIHDEPWKWLVRR